MKFTTTACTIAGALLTTNLWAQAPAAPPSDPPVAVPRAEQTQPVSPAPGSVQTPRPGAGARASQALRNVFVPLKWEDLPPAVQTTVMQKAGSQKIDDIDREDRKGQTVYEIEFKRDGKDTEIHVAADGAILPDEYESTTKDTDVKASDSKPKSLEAAVYVGPKFKDLPAAVQNTVKQHAQSEQIADIDIERRSGRLVYEVEFEVAGRNNEIHVAEDGTLIPQPTGRTDVNLPKNDNPPVSP